MSRKMSRNWGLCYDEEYRDLYHEIFDTAKSLGFLKGMESPPPLYWVKNQQRMLGGCVEIVCSYLPTKIKAIGIVVELTKLPIQFAKGVLVHEFAHACADYGKVGANHKHDHVFEYYARELAKACQVDMEYVNQHVSETTAAQIRAVYPDRRRKQPEKTRYDVLWAVSNRDGVSTCRWLNRAVPSAYVDSYKSYYGSYFFTTKLERDRLAEKFVEEMGL